MAQRRSPSSSLFYRLRLLLFTLPLWAVGSSGYRAHQHAARVSSLCDAALSANVSDVGTSLQEMNDKGIGAEVNDDGVSNSLQVMYGRDIAPSQDGAIRSQQHGERYPALIYATWPGIADQPIEQKKSIIDRLLRAGADINAQGTDGRTALMVTTNPQIAMYLLQRGARMDLRDKSGKSALDRAIAESDTAKQKVLQGVKVF